MCLFNLTGMRYVNDRLQIFTKFLVFLFSHNPKKKIPARQSKFLIKTIATHRHQNFSVKRP